ncbi:hypothetical protein EXM22_10940 [Oceanispirochaeta crateris]|uniref:Uncharacterized protein n=1 Tax=Oceanispirochaeta crateris TaxID=2518645 RepID=A0A5C1QPH4_9SPIO|nr:PG0541 family transporter-associated protein [Oceanispirochaeta crateris]QEN08476.1 hypothetical protein EXM22_10940 [Oceanispirochaeta crateris]
MTRLEIIANNTVEDDIQDALKSVEIDFSYTRLNAVHGRGHSEPKAGNAVWPEENFIYLIYTEDDMALRFVAALKKIKERFTNEGIKVFAIPFANPIEI